MNEIKKKLTGISAVNAMDCYSAGRTYLLDGSEYTIKELSAKPSNDDTYNVEVTLIKIETKPTAKQQIKDAAVELSVMISMLNKEKGEKLYDYETCYRLMVLADEL